MTTYRVGIARRPDGAVEGWAHDLPGCRAVAGSMEALEPLLPVAINEYLGWLDRHKALPADAYPVDYEIVEDISPPGEWVFKAEYEPISREELASVAERVSFAHEDLMLVTRVLTDTVLDWKPPASAVKIDQIYPDVRSIREMTQHVATALTFHIAGIGDVVARVPGPEDRDNLQGAYEATVKRLASLTDEERSGKAYTLNTARGETDWTARKSLRRIINHQRFHTREIEQRLAWVLLGVPDVLPVARE